ncbi:hemagglutinin repeat-containing protein [Paraburkholderia sediminicola]|uniref:hemagglutinin repeat-containing protein n=1 Tax=Paraburkholderia sediminicola TaxID=458836 RepID=UPI0038BCB2C3
MTGVVIACERRITISIERRRTRLRTGSTLAAGGTVTLVATGSGAKDANGVATDGDINARGTQITAQDVTLNAARDVNLQSAHDTTKQNSSNSSSNASIGVGFGLGGTQNGFTLELAASAAKGNANGNSVTNRDTQISAGNTVSITSGRDTNLRGAEVSGNTVDANVGRDLNIASQQDTNTYDSQQTSAGFQASICVPPFCYGQTVSGSANASDQTIKDRFQSVNRQSGIQAGSGGYNINVGNHTELGGGVIASTATPDKNLLSTQTFGYTNLQNTAESSGSTLGASLSGSAGESSPEGVSFSPSKDSPYQNQLGQAGLGVAGVSSSASGTTYAAVSPATITVRGDAGTGHDSTAGLSRDVAGANAGAVQNTFDAQKVQDDMAVQQGTVQVGMQVAGDIATKLEDQANRNVDRAKAARDAANDPQDEAQAQADLDAANREAALWGNDGAARIASHAVVAGLGAALGGGSAAGAVGGTVAGDLVGNAASNALGDTAGGKLVSNVASGLAGALAGGALGGSAGAMSGANGALGADLYNKQMHKSQKDKLAELQKGETPDEQQRLADAACALVGCAAGLSDNDPAKAAELASQQRGAGYVTELGELQATGLFPQYSNADAAADIASQAKDWVAQYLASVGRGAANFGNAYLNKIVQNGPQGSYVNPDDLNRTNGGGDGPSPTAGAMVTPVPCPVGPGACGMAVTPVVTPGMPGYVPETATLSSGNDANSGSAGDSSGSSGKSRNKPPPPLPEADGLPHTIIERPGPDGQYTTYNSDGTSLQYRGSGQDHGGIPRPNVKETSANVAPDGTVFVGKGVVRPATPNEIPGGK